MIASILNSTKKILNVDPNSTAFDVDILTHINTAFFKLKQLGIGPEEGFAIEDDEAVWGDYTDGDISLNGVKTYIFLCVRTWFDPPNTSFGLAAMEHQIQEFEWRLNVEREFTRIPTQDGYVQTIDGGQP